MQEVFTFWFGTLDEQGLPHEDVAKRWYQKSADFDQEIRDTFASTHAALVEDESLWRESVKQQVAAIIVLDQFSRNMFRDTAQMYAHDDAALSRTLTLVETKEEQSLPLSQRAFVYMPLMHSESILHQEMCVQLFTAFEYELKGEAKKTVSNYLGYAIKHRDIVAQFERFPHRNEILGRASTPEEQKFLEQPGSSF